MEKVAQVSLWIQKNKRLVIILGLGIASIATVYVLPIGEDVPPAATAGLNKSSVSVPVSKPADSKQVAANTNKSAPKSDKDQDKKTTSAEGMDEAARDPFSIPREYSSTSLPANTPVSRVPDTSANSMGRAGGVAVNAAVTFKLTGIAQGDDNVRVAVIYDGKQSKAYYQGSFVGEYKIISINDSSVTLEGAGGRQQIMLQRRDTNPEMNHTKEGTGAK